MKNIKQLLALLLVVVPQSYADERLFTYNYEANVLPVGESEFEQHITHQNGKEDGDFAAWNFRTEFEYGVTEQYTSALYLNFDSIHSEGVTDVEDSDGMDFKGISWENVYQLLNPNLDPIGLAAYVELGGDGTDFEAESKLLLSKPIGNLNLVFNATYEAEWEKDDGEREKEAELSFTAGASYKIAPKWALGIEARNKSAYPDGLDLSQQEYNSWSVGPNLHYGNPKWWATLTVLPQVWGNGDGSNDHRQLVHEEAVEIRLIFGMPL